MNCSHSANKVDRFQKSTIQSKGYTGYKWSPTFQWPAALPSLENPSDAVDVTHWILRFPESWHERTHLRKQKMTSCRVFTHWHGSLRHPKATIEYMYNLRLAMLPATWRSLQSNVMWRRKPWFKTIFIKLHISQFSQNDKYSVFLNIRLLKKIYNFFFFCIIYQCKGCTCTTGRTGEYILYGRQNMAKYKPN